MCERERESVREGEESVRSSEKVREDEDGWQQAKRRNRIRNLPPNITSFFVYNLPPSMNSSDLKTLFQRHGFMTDAYIAQKKDKYGNPFGFIRFKNVRNIKVFLSSLQNMKYEGMVINVNLAKADKRGNPTTHATFSKPNNPHNPLNPKISKNPYYYQPSFFPPQHQVPPCNYIQPPFTSSFKDKLTTPPPPPIPSVKLALPNPKTPNAWKKTSIIATFKDFNAL